MNDRDAVTQTEELITASLPGVTKVEIGRFQIDEAFLQWRIYVEMRSAYITDFVSSLDAESQRKIVGRLKAAWERYKAA